MKDHAHAQTGADGLGENQLVVLCGQGLRHQAENDEERAEGDGNAGPVAVEEDADEGCQSGQGEELQSGDPRDGAGRVLRKEMRLVVVLVDAGARDEAVAGEQTEPSAENRQPRLSPAVREVGRRRRAGFLAFLGRHVVDTGTSSAIIAVGHDTGIIIGVAAAAAV